MKDLASVLKVPKSALTAKQRKFAKAIVLDEMTGADAYRSAYNTKANPKQVGTDASKLKANPRIAAEIAALERAKELSAWHSAESLRSLVISTLTEIATDADTKSATRVQAVKVLGTVVGVDAFRETKRIEHVQDSGEIKAQIMDQLKTLMLGTNDAQDVDADSLLAELASDETGDSDPYPTGDTPNPERDSGSHVHTIPHEPSPAETTPLSQESPTPRGDIFGEKDEVAK